eukprot:scaffold59317_cov19-Tisochrysis_lutea.AAC.2
MAALTGHFMKLCGWSCTSFYLRGQGVTKKVSGRLELHQAQSEILGLKRCRGATRLRACSGMC